MLDAFEDREPGEAVDEQTVEGVGDWREDGDDLPTLDDLSESEVLALIDDELADPELEDAWDDGNEDDAPNGR